VTRCLLALAAQATVFWLLLAALGPGQVAWRTWMVLHALLALALLAVYAVPWPAARWGAGRWLAVAFYAAFLSAFFAGADAGLDALQGTRPARAAPWPALGGLALWQLLFPGIFSLAAGGPQRCSITPSIGSAASFQGARLIMSRVSE
jgi:hypothetical protein